MQSFTLFPQLVLLLCLHTWLVFTWDFVSGKINFFQYGARSICYNCLHEIPRMKLIGSVISLRSFWQNSIVLDKCLREISFRARWIFFQYGVRSICYNCLHEYPEWNLLQVLYHRGHFDRNEISFRVIRCYINTTSKWDHTNLAVASKLQSKVSCGKETEYAFWSYNHIHNILILFDGWANLPFTTSETRLDY